ncbi:unnamed protein product, partial [marine sediment metagenome]
GDSPIFKNNKEIPAHSWVIVVKISDALWPVVSKCTGLSMQGVCRRKSDEDN